MADDKARADKVAAARKKAALKKASEVKGKKGKTAAASKEDDAAAAASTDLADEPKDDDAPAEESVSTPAASEPQEPAPTAAVPADEPTPAAAAVVSSSTGSTAALEAKLAELEKECEAAKSARDEAQLMSEALEKKVASLEMLHAEDESQISRLERDLSESRDETMHARDKLQKAEAEVLRLSKKEAQDSGGTDNDHLDELEDEERQKLQARIRELEAENTDLRRGIWVDKRREMQPGMDDTAFTNVDLGAASSSGAHRKPSGFGDFFTTGLNALTGASGQHEHDEDGFLEDDDDFDEEAFRKAQEDAAKARIERIREVKRGLTKWTNWRLDLVEARAGGGEGIGEIFEV